MTPINIAIVGLRLLAVYCFVEAAQVFSVYGPLGLVNALANPEMFGHNDMEAILATSIPGVLSLLLAILLYIFSKPLARRLAPPVSDETKEIICSFEQLQTVLFAAAGLLILAKALPSMGRALDQLIKLYHSHESGQHFMTYYSWFYFGGVVAQVILGLMLLLNPKGFRNVWRWLRTAGT